MWIYIFPKEKKKLSEIFERQNSADESYLFLMNYSLLIFLFFVLRFYCSFSSFTFKFFIFFFKNFIHHFSYISFSTHVSFSLSSFFFLTSSSSFLFFISLKNAFGLRFFFFFFFFLSRLQDGFMSFDSRWITSIGSWPFVDQSRREK